MPSSHRDDLERPDPPLGADEVRRRPAEEPSAEPPKEFRSYFTGEAAPRKTTRFIDRSNYGRAAAERRLVTDGHRPPWLRASYAPRRVPLPPPRRVIHHGERLEPFIIWGGDDRRAYNDPNSYPWRCVCKITTAFGRMGSGCLIGPRHVLTASHVVEWSTDRAELIEVHLVGTAATATAFDTVAYAFTQIQGDPTVTTLDEDYAVLVLDQRLGDAFGWLGTKEYDSGWDGENIWWTMGYAGDAPIGGERRNPLFQQHKNLDEDEWDLGSGRAMTTSFDMMGGQSGSPVFGFWDDGISYAVAVMSAGGTVWASGFENWCSGGADLPGLVNLARGENP